VSKRPQPRRGVLGVIPHHLDHSDGELRDDAALRLELVRSVRSVRPDVVCCPDPTAVFFGDGYFNHRDHRITGWAALDAVAPAAGNPHYFPELRSEGLDIHAVSAVYLSGTLEPNAWVDINRDPGTQDRSPVLSTQVSSSKPASGSASSCAIRPRSPDEPAGVTYARRSAGSLFPERRVRPAGKEAET